MKFLDMQDLKHTHTHQVAFLGSGSRRKYKIQMTHEVRCQATAKVWARKLSTLTTQETTGSKRKSQKNNRRGYLMCLYELRRH
jgi:hypothetical protein